MSIRTQATESVNKMINTIKEDKIALEQELSEKEKLKRKIAILRGAINTVITISPNEIIFKHNVRHKVDEESSEFTKLCESIKKFGLMKNIVAELRVSPREDSYELICVAGHRRLTALNKLGLEDRIPCLLKSYDEDNNGDRVGAALSENLNREGLGCVDIADGYRELKNSGWSDDDLVKHFEKNKKTIAQYLRLSELPDDIKDIIRQQPEKLSTRVVFREVLAKHSTVGEIRKTVNRKIETQKPDTNRGKRTKIKDQLNAFFEKENLSEEIKNTVIRAFKFTGILP
jgi:ParB/RepB/Spo0J family partition protein